MINIAGAKVIASFFFFAICVMLNWATSLPLLNKRWHGCFLGKGTWDPALKLSVSMSLEHLIPGQSGCGMNMQWCCVIEERGTVLSIA